MWYEKQIEGFFNLICAYWVIWGLLVERFIQMEWPCHLYKQSKEKRSIHTYVVYCWTSYSCPLIYTSIWIQILHYLDYCYCIVLTSDSHVTKQCGDIEKKKSVISLATWFFSLKIILTMFLAFLYKFYQLANFYKQACWDFD